MVFCVYYYKNEFKYFLKITKTYFGEHCNYSTKGHRTKQMILLRLENVDSLYVQYCFSIRYLYLQVQNDPEIV